MLVVVFEVRIEHAFEMISPEDDKTVHAFSSDAPVESLGIWILPRAARSCQDLLNPYVLDAPPKPSSVDGITIPKQVLGSRIPWKRLDYLLGRPFSSRVRRYIEMDDAPSLDR